MADVEDFFGAFGYFFRFADAFSVTGDSRVLSGWHESGAD
jgi:hypothetical protein